MKILLAALPHVFADRGIYPTPDGTRISPKFLLLHPDAARRLAMIEETWPGYLRFSDVYRSPASSLAAVKAKRGAQPPGFSAHNFGLAVDLAIDRTLRASGWSYHRLIDRMAEAGWYCHRRDGKRGHEDWHFNWLGKQPGRYLSQAGFLRRTWSRVAEQRILDQYGHEFALDPVRAQRALAELKLYHGNVDGIVGPMTRAATQAFQRAYGIRPTGSLDAKTERTLAVVTAELVVRDLEVWVETSG